MDVTRILKTALGTLQKQRARIDRQIASLELAMGRSMGRSAARPKGRKRARRSAASRRAASLRMKAYWAKRRAKGKK